MCPGRCSGGFGNSSIVFHVSKSTIGQVGVETFLRLDVEKMREVVDTLPFIPGTNDEPLYSKVLGSDNW